MFVRKLCHSLNSTIKKIDYYNKTVHDILTKEIPFIFPNSPKNRKEKRHTLPSLVTGLIRLAYEGISSYLHNKWQKGIKESIHCYGKSRRFRMK